jgi:ParB family transcriptional regulator, chromosome partitioning protein
MELGSLQQVELIPVDRISVINPRARNPKIFKEIVANIAQLGLKRPITVTRRRESDGFYYDLICGQGRLEAYRALGQSEIPARIIEAGIEDGAIMGLVENLARRKHRAIDLLQEIEGLKRRGYDDVEIARKTALSLEYVRGVIGLLKNGEHRLLRAVEWGHVPISVALEIAQSSDAEVQKVLQQAYENKILRGHKLIAAKRLIERRRRQGKGFRPSGQRYEPPLSPNALIRAYREDVDRKRILIRKATATRDRLIFVTEALRKLLADEGFVTLLRAEGLDTLPKNLADRIQAWKEA